MTTTDNQTDKTIRTNDVLYARVTVMGRQLFNIRLSDMDSFAQVVNWVKVQLSGFTGLVKISLRNASQGWSADHWCRMSSTEHSLASQI